MKLKKRSAINSSRYYVSSDVLLLNASKSRIFVFFFTRNNIYYVYWFSFAFNCSLSKLPPAPSSEHTCEESGSAERQVFVRNFGASISSKLFISFFRLRPLGIGMLTVSTSSGVVLKISHAIIFVRRFSFRILTRRSNNLVGVRKYGVPYISET